MKLILILCLSVYFQSCASQKLHPNTTESDGLNSIIQEFTESSKLLDAFAAPYFNVEENLSKFGDYASPAFFVRKRAIYKKAFEALQNVHTRELSETDKRTYAIFKEDIDTSIAWDKFPTELMEFNQMGNRIHSYLDDSSQSLTSFPFDTVKHYDDFISRANGFIPYIDNQIALLKRGLREGIVLNCPAARAVLNTYKDGLESNVEKNPFFRPIGFMPSSFPDSDKKRLTEEFKKMVTNRIYPGFVKFDAFYKKKYLPQCRKSFGIGSLPSGKAWYAEAIRRNTNLSLTPKEVHEKGLAEVARISYEMQKIQNILGFKGTLNEFQKSLTEDPKYFFTSPEQMFTAFKKVKSDVNQKVPNYFDLIPAHDFKIVETSNPEDASGSYTDPTDITPYGRFIVNTKNLRSVPTYEVTTLLLHEAIPGHHFQLALQYEMKNQLSEYQRKLFFSNSFVEGWALYAEYLGNEMGMFNDPLQRLGNLNDEMLRAVRLVVDSGIHAYGWSREKANRYMQEHLATDAKDISNEVNRYSVWPGQALGYKIGQLKIIELRKKAEAELKNRFNLKGFHRVVIGSGTVSLGILENQVNQWIASVKSGTYE